jgi:hypothetical protein
LSILKISKCALLKILEILKTQISLLLLIFKINIKVEFNFYHFQQSGWKTGAWEEWMNSHSRGNRQKQRGSAVASIRNYWTWRTNRWQNICDKKLCDEITVAILAWLMQKESGLALLISAFFSITTHFKLKIIVQWREMCKWLLCFVCPLTLLVTVLKNHRSL